MLRLNNGLYADKRNSARAQAVKQIFLFDEFDELQANDRVKHRCFLHKKPSVSAYMAQTIDSMSCIGCHCFSRDKKTHPREAYNCPTDALFASVAVLLNGPAPHLLIGIACSVCTGDLALKIGLECNAVQRDHLILASLLSICQQQKI
jgi:hypothetical protein